MTPEPMPPGDLGSGAMFDRIAPRYDLLNRLMSLGLDQRWRAALVRAVTADLCRPSAVSATPELLDIATGTGDLAIALARACPAARIVGVDASAGMLAVAASKLAAVGLTDRITTLVADAYALPFAADRFAGATMAFGLRNLADRPRALAEMARVTRPGGLVAVLELAEPAGGWLGCCARLHVHYAVPLLGALGSGRREYRYLRESIAAFPRPEVITGMMRDLGLAPVSLHRLSFGAAYLYTAEKPMAS